MLSGPSEPDPGMPQAGRWRGALAIVLREGDQGVELRSRSGTCSIGDRLGPGLALQYPKKYRSASHPGSDFAPWGRPPLPQITWPMRRSAGPRPT